MLEGSACLDVISLGHLSRTSQSGEAGELLGHTLFPPPQGKMFSQGPHTKQSPVGSRSGPYSPMAHGPFLHLYPHASPATKPHLPNPACFHNP